MTERIAVIGLGYVGLPVALALAQRFPGTLGFDIHKEKLEELARGEDRNGEVPQEALRSTTLKMTTDPSALQEATFFVVAVPTPVDKNNVPDLTPVDPRIGDGRARAHARAPSSSTSRPSIRA